jgi:tetratricopeptide (TPR) repeat protein
MTRTLTLVAALLLPFTAPALADQKRDDRAWREAKEHFKRGQRLHDNGKYDEAIVEYEAAYRLAPIPDLLFNLGLVYRLKGEHAKAIDAYERYLDAAPDGPGASDAREFLAELRAGKTPDAKPVEEPAVDDQPPPIRPAVDPRAQPEIEPDPAPRADVDQPSPGRGLRIAGIVTGSVGLVGIALGVKFGLDARAASDDISGARDMWTLALDERIREGERAERNMWISYAVGGAALAAGGVLYWLGMSAAGDSAVAVVPSRDGATVVVGGGF